MLKPLSYLRVFQPGSPVGHKDCAGSTGPCTLKRGQSGTDPGCGATPPLLPVEINIIYDMEKCYCFMSKRSNFMCHANKTSNFSCVKDTLFHHKFLSKSPDASYR